MSERIFQLSNLHGVDSHFRLRYGEGYKKVLHPFEPICDEELCFGIIDNGHLVSGRLMLSPRDREEIKLTVPETGETTVFTLPGKSAIIILDTDCCDREFTKKLARAYLDCPKPDKDHRLHLANPEDIRKAGWIPYWTPYQLERKILHAQLVAERTVLTGEEPTISDAERLTQAFRRIC